MDTPVAEWDQMVAVNVQGMLYVAHAALDPRPPGAVNEMLVRASEQTW